MTGARPPFIPYPPIERLGVIGDRRTAAMVAADGTICWWCLPDYDGSAVFGALLDAERGGYFRLGPAAAVFGEQCYMPDTAVLTTRWEVPEGVLELTDAMLWPETDRPPPYRDRRVILRRLRGIRGRVRCIRSINARPDFAPPAAAAPDGVALEPNGSVLSIWSNRPAPAVSSEEFDLAAGDEIWVVLGLCEDPACWSVGRARDALEATVAYWTDWCRRLKFNGARADWIKQSALLVHLLSSAPTGAPIAAPTVSLPERIGGGRNFDYRYAWIRDASLALSLLAELGFTGDEERYLDWLARLPTGKAMPLQTVYRVDGATEAPLRPRDDLNGYRQSRPVQFGNPAFHMPEIGSFGFLADCVWAYVERGGTWKEEYWRLMRRIADFVAGNWREPDAGIWELQPRNFVASRVLCWAVLDRAIKIGERVGRDDVPIAPWRAEMDAIRAEVMSRGWCDAMNSFRQHYDADTVDAALLLIPLLDFLPPDDPRVQGTVARIEARLMINGFVYRFFEKAFPEQGEQPLGEEEGAFAMCTCWLAHYYAQLGDRDRADAILRRVENTAPAGLLAEAIDGRAGVQLGNTPLLFSQVEYAKAAMAQAGVALDRGPGRR
ncbi:MAG: glycoside hydrolase family 15 protein [Alphaproteobacteria bacterium]